MDFKILSLIYKVLNGLEWKYLIHLCTTKHPDPSGDLSLLSVARIKTKQDEAAFSFSSLNRWNKLPEYLRSATPVSSFKSGLKTSIFTVWPFCKLRYRSSFNPQLPFLALDIIILLSDSFWHLCFYWLLNEVSIKLSFVAFCFYYLFSAVLFPLYLILMCFLYLCKVFRITLCLNSAV